MIRWWEHGQKGVTDGQTDRQTDRRTENTIHRAAWSQLKIYWFSIKKCHLKRLSIVLFHPQWVYYECHNFTWKVCNHWFYLDWEVSSGHIFILDVWWCQYIVAKYFFNVTVAKYSFNLIATKHFLQFDSIHHVRFMTHINCYKIFIMHYIQDVYVIESGTLTFSKLCSVSLTLKWHCNFFFNKIWNWWMVISLRLSDTYRHQETKPSLVDTVACHLFSAKTLSEPTMIYC